jgi:hypothetical protein
MPGPTAPEPITEDLQIAETAISRLAQQMRSGSGLPELTDPTLNNTERLVAIFAAQVQELETVFLQLFEETTLETAEGVQLDNIGRIVGRERADETDTEYRARLRAQIQLNMSSGTIEQVLLIVDLALGDGIPLVMTEGTIAEFEIDVLGSITPEIAARVALVLGTAKAGAVKANLKYFDETPVFAYDGAGGAKYDGGYKYASSIDSGSTLT